MARHRRPPSQTWRTFLDNHLRSLVAVDFFTVPTVTFKVLFVFVVLAHHRRRVVHCNVTDAPMAAWTVQQRVESLHDGAQVTLPVGSFFPYSPAFTGGVFVGGAP